MGAKCSRGKTDPAASKTDGFIPYDQRKCRDVLCCALFGLFWIGMIIIGSIGFHFGHPQRLVYGADYQGDVCGVGDKKGSKYTVYPRVTEDFVINYGVSNPLNYKFYGVCTSSCPKMLDVICNYNTPVSSDPAVQEQMRQCILKVDASNSSCAQWQANCWITPQDTSSIFFRCIPVYNVTNDAVSSCIYPSNVTSPNDPRCMVVRDNRNGAVDHPAKPNYLFDQMNTARQIWGRWFGDLYRAWWVIIVCAVGCALLFGFFWLLLAKWCTGVFVWGTIVLVLIAMGFLTGYFYYKAGLVTVQLPDSISDKLNSFKSSMNSLSSATSYTVPQTFNSAASYATAYKVLAYSFTAFTLIMLAMVIALRRSIKTAIAVIKLGAEALQALPGLLFFPFTTVLALGLFVAWWIFAAAYLATAGKVTVADVKSDVAAGVAALEAQYGSAANLSSILNSTSLNSSFSTIDDYNAMNYCLIYHFFGGLWTTQFILGIACMTVAGAVSNWYFSLNESNNPEVEPLRAPRPKLTVLSSLYRTLRFYLGTIAFGSLLIAIIQFIRAVLAYVQRQMKQHGQDNATIRFVMCCVQCCLKCIQTCVEIVTRNAYVYTALKGYSFCESGRKVFMLIINNAATLAVVNVLGELIMFLGKVLIAACCGWVAYAILDNAKPFQPGGESEISSTWLVILVTVFFAYAIASGFMSVYDLAVDTVLVCYVTDMEENQARHSGDSKHAIPIHVRADKLAYGHAASDAQRTKGAELTSPASGGANPLRGEGPKVN